MLWLSEGKLVIFHNCSHHISACSDMHERSRYTNNPPGVYFAMYMYDADGTRGGHACLPPFNRRLNMYLPGASRE